MIVSVSEGRFRYRLDADQSVWTLAPAECGDRFAYRDPPATSFTMPVSGTLESVRIDGVDHPVGGARTPDRIPGFNGELIGRTVDPPPDAVGTPSKPPAHYSHTPHQPIEVTRYMIGGASNAFKYLCRAGAKGSEVEDLRKAKRYLEDAIEHSVGVFDRELLIDDDAMATINRKAIAIAESLVMLRGQAARAILETDLPEALAFVDREIARLTK